MSSHNRLNEKTSELGLKHILKNWSSRQQPPKDGKARLLKAAAKEPDPSMSFLSVLIYLAVNDNVSDLYVTRYKTSPVYTVQPGSLGLSTSKGMV